MPITKIPHLIPVATELNAGAQALAAPVDTGGYDVLVGGVGFRLATDIDYPYSRYTEPTTTQRIDSSDEPSEHTLSALPWIKSQSSFHGGSGQLNLEAPLSSFQYQEAHVEHLRYDQSQNIDVWTPGEVKRLPDVSRYNFGIALTVMTMANVGGIDYAICGGGPGAGLWQVAWLSGPDAAPTLTQINDGDYGAGGRGTTTVISITNDGTNYYAMLVMANVNSFGVQVQVVKGTIGSTAGPTSWAWRALATTWSGQVAFVKQRLILAEADYSGSFIYELSTTTSPGSLGTLTPNYTYPNLNTSVRAIATSPTAILVASDTGGYNSGIIALTLTSSGGTPTLTGGAEVAAMPTGEAIYSMKSYAGSFLAIGTNLGLRLATFDTYTGALSMGPLSIKTTSPVYSISGRDRFFFGSYNNQQPDGKTGLFRVDFTQPIDSAGRCAYAPDLHAPSAAPTGLGNVTAVSLLPQASRLVYLTSEGIFVEGNGPGSDGDAWLRTSRIRFSTAEKKLFKLGRINGTLDVASIQVTGIAPFKSDANLGTFGFITNGDPGEFLMPAGLNEWIQLKFTLIGASCKLNTYYVKALPAPKRQHLIELTVNCFAQEVDRYGLEVTDPKTPRERYQAVADLEAIGDQIQYVEFTNTGPRVENVVIDVLKYTSHNRPNLDDDFGGRITFKLRTTET